MKSIGVNLTNILYLYNILKTLFLSKAGFYYEMNIKIVTFSKKTVKYTEDFSIIGYIILYKERI